MAIAATLLPIGPLRKPPMAAGGPKINTVHESTLKAEEFAAGWSQAVRGASGGRKAL